MGCPQRRVDAGHWPFRLHATSPSRRWRFDNLRPAEHNPASAQIAVTIVGAQHLYLSLRSQIDEAIRRVCSRHRLSEVDAQDFSSTVHLHIIKGDYAVLGDFQERSSIRTYLHTVVGNQYQDWRNAKWGKYRPSAAARRQGPVAVHLERLIVRDRLTFDQAYETLRTNFAVTDARTDLEAAAAGFRSRPGRHFVSDEGLAEQAAYGDAPDEPIRQREAVEVARAAAGALARALGELPTEDQLILRMRFTDGFQVVEIARALHVDQRQLYRRINRLLSELRKRLGRAGFTPTTAAEVLDQGGFGLLDDDGEGGRKLRETVRPFSEGPRSAVDNERTPS